MTTMLSLIWTSDRIEMMKWTGEREKIRESPLKRNE
jgi:hypothetical protein